MSFDPFTAALDLGKMAIERLWPDPNKRAEEMRKLEEIRQTGDLAQLNAHVQLMLGQLEVNKEEAKSSSLFVAGWRPAVGWVGALSLALVYIPKALVMTAMWTVQSYMVLKTSTDPLIMVLPVFPDLGLSDILGLLGAMLGVGAMRSYDKGKGTDTKKLS